MAEASPSGSTPSSAGPHPKMSFAAAAHRVATVSNREKFERLKASREKAKAKLTLARAEIARCVRGRSWREASADATRVCARYRALHLCALTAHARGAGCSRRPRRRRARAPLQVERCAFERSAPQATAMRLTAAYRLTRHHRGAQLRRENEELRRALLAQIPELTDEEGSASVSEQTLRAALNSEQRLRAEAVAEVAFLRSAVWGTSGLAAAAVLALAYARLTRG